VREAIERLNETLDSGRAVGSTAETVLIGEGGQIDSMGLVLLIASIEEEVEREWGARISLIDVVTDEERVPRTVGDLTRCTAELVAAAGAR
jgi:acyl carrier protein